MSSERNTVLPATMTFAPAEMTSFTFSSVMPPSTSISSSGLPAQMQKVRSRSIFSSVSGMKRWPPQPGCTLMRSSISASPTASKMLSTGVLGLMTAEAFMP